jgi:hypothetical protein
MISLAIWCWRRSLNKNPLTISPTFRLSPHCTVDETNNVSRTYGVSIYHPPITMPPSATSKGVHLKSEGFPLMMLCEDLVPMSSLTDRPTIREQSKTFSTIISWILYNDVFTSIYSIAMPLSKCRGLNNPSSTPNHNLLIIGQTIKQPKNCRVPLLDNIGTFASELTHTPSTLNNSPSMTLIWMLCFGSLSNRGHTWPCLMMWLTNLMRGTNPYNKCLRKCISYGS